MPSIIAMIGRTVKIIGVVLTSLAIAWCFIVISLHSFRFENVTPNASITARPTLSDEGEAYLALILSDYSATWHRSRGLLSINVSAGSMSICESNQPRRLEMRNPASIALVVLRNEIMEQALNDSRQPRVELQERQGLQDQTMRHLMEILLYEKRQGFQSGAFFLDGIAAALASHLIRCYSPDAPVITNSVGGMAPSTLRRCIALMEARLEGDLRLAS
ncbi:MAG: hypothetical protein WCA20_15340 [Candidatus Sulfotelmatobacter sp.]